MTDNISTLLFNDKLVVKFGEISVPFDFTYLGIQGDAHHAIQVLPNHISIIRIKSMEVCLVFTVYDRGLSFGCGQLHIDCNTIEHVEYVYNNSKIFESSHCDPGVKKFYSLEAIRKQVFEYLLKQYDTAKLQYFSTI